MIQKIVIAILLTFCGGSIFGQTTGRISGQVLDQSQASVPGATVTAENTATGERRDVQTDQQGRYVFADLSVGTYKVTVEAKGFQSQVRPDLRLNVASTLVADFTVAAGR